MWGGKAFSNSLLTKSMISVQTSLRPYGTHTYICTHTHVYMYTHNTHSTHRHTNAWFRFAAPTFGGSTGTWGNFCLPKNFPEELSYLVKVDLENLSLNSHTLEMCSGAPNCFPLSSSLPFIHNPHILRAEWLHLKAWGLTVGSNWEEQA